MRTSDMIKSKFFGARDLQGQAPLVLTIAHVTEELFSRGGHPEMQYFVWFTDHQKGLKLNKTRVQVLEAAYGPDSDLWTGHRVRLSFDPTVKFGNVLVGSIRIETPAGRVYQAQAAAASWGAPASAPAGAPPPPVWDAATQTWRTQQPAPAPAPSRVPPAPVWNAATGQWDVVNPSTGEIAPPRPAPGPAPAQPGSQFAGQAGTWGGTTSLGDRLNARPPADEWSGQSENPAPAGAVADFDDDIPF